MLWRLGLPVTVFGVLFKLSPTLPTRNLMEWLKGSLSRGEAVFIVSCMVEDDRCLKLDRPDKVSELPGREQLWVISEAFKGGGVLSSPSQ